MNARNLILKEYMEKDIPVHLSRGWTLKSSFAPVSGYRYDGLYKVAAMKEDKSEKDFRIYRFSLERLPGQPVLPVKAVVSYGPVRPRKVRKPVPTKKAPVLIADTQNK